MKVTATVIKEFDINFPEELFEESHMENIRSYCQAHANIDEKELKLAIIEAYAEHGEQYYEQFGAYVGVFGWSRPKDSLFVEIKREDSFIDDLEVHDD